MKSVPLNRALLASLAAALLVSLVPAGLALDRRIEASLVAKVRSDLSRAPMVLTDRNKGRADALMMHAREVAGAPGLGAALARADEEAANQLLTVAMTGEEPVLVDGSGRVVVGVDPGPALLAATRAGRTPVDFVEQAGQIRVLSVAPVVDRGRWVGAAGVSEPVNATTAATLSGLTASNVVILGRDGGTVASTMEPPRAQAVARRVHGADASVREARDDALGRFWMVVAPLGEVGYVAFTRDAAQELAVLPRLRRGALLAAGIVLAVALLIGLLVSNALARPVVGLARAADRLADGDFHAPLERSRIREVDRMARAFDHMRRALADRLEELGQANRELEHRQERLHTLQAEMIQRDRLVASGRLVAELAHEIRNPVANVRNCLEVIHRRVSDDPKVREFADLAIDELLRMHELAEQMLDLNRPVDPAAASCDALDVVSRVAALFSTGPNADRWPVVVAGDVQVAARMAPDTLKQVLLNLVQNAREAMPDGGPIGIHVSQDDDFVRIDVTDEGTGMSDDVLPRVFDPFFTTKGEVRGVGLGLFIAEGLVRRHGGRLTAENRDDVRGARFRVALPAGSATGGRTDEPQRVEQR
jgi:two-component system NtrC family sensor kinase